MARTPCKYQQGLPLVPMLENRITDIETAINNISKSCREFKSAGDEIALQLLITNIRMACAAAFFSIKFAKEILPYITTKSEQS